jgi:MerR family transcriptional regulator, thiopeptide resistance regulator
MAVEFQDVIPVLPYRDIRAGHDYLVRVLGFESGGVVEDGDGKVVHAEVRAGPRRFWLHEASGSLAPPAAGGTRSSGMVLHVSDVDQHFRRAVDAGAEILRPPTDEDYGQREYGLRDCEGHDWYVATPTEQSAAR